MHLIYGIDFSFFKYLSPLTIVHAIGRKKQKKKSIKFFFLIKMKQKEIIMKSEDPNAILCHLINTNGCSFVICIFTCGKFLKNKQTYRQR